VEIPHQRRWHDIGQQGIAMHRIRNAVVTTTLATCLSLTTQTASGQSVGNLGLRMPNLQTAIEKGAIKPDFAPDVFAAPKMGSLPGLTPGPSAPGQAPGAGGPTPGVGSLGTRLPTPPPRSLADPVVAANSVGFYNDSGQKLSFQFISGGVSQKIELTPRQVLTIQVDAADAELKAIVGTGGTDFQTSLSRGKIYVLRADGAKWVLAAY
jgi:hypothetical protein